MAISLKGRLRIAVFIFLTTFCFPYILHAQSRIADRNQVIEDQLQAAIDQARLEGTEQSQENFRRIYDRNVQEIKPLGSERTYLDGIEIAVEPASNDEESTQAEFLKKEENVNAAIVPVGVDTNILEISPEPPNPLDPRMRLKKIELALQTASYNYKTKDNFPTEYAGLYAIGNKVEKNGKLYGLYASYTYRRPYKIPVRSWSDLSLALDRFGSLPSFIRAEADLSFGQTSYDSYVTGKRSGYNAWQGNIRFLGGYDFLSQGDSFMITPYTGIGYYRASDKTGGWYDWGVATGYREYENVISFFYLPVGVEALKEFNEDWDGVFKLEGSYIFAGTVDFNHGDIPGLFASVDYTSGLPVDIHLKDTQSVLKGGFGVKTSLKGIRKLRSYNFFVEPFFEMWYLAKSKPEEARGVDTSDVQRYSVKTTDGSPYKPVFEASNYTLKFGLRLGVQF